MPNKIRKATGKIDNAKTKALDNGVVEVIVATNSRDRHGEILDIKGLNVKDYNGVVLWGHDMFSFPIGKTITLRKTQDGKLVARAQLAIEEYDFAATAYKLIKGGYVQDVSVGFIPQQYDPETDTWVKSEMVEWSFVSIGANKDAKVTNKALAEIGLTKEEFEEQVKEHATKMKAFENDDADPPEEPEPKFDDDLEEETETPADPEPSDVEQKAVDKTPANLDNVFSQLDLMESAISDTRAALKGLPTETEADKTKTIKKRIILIQARKSLKTVDRVAELALSQVKDRIKESGKDGR